MGADQQHRGVADQQRPHQAGQLLIGGGDRPVLPGHGLAQGEYRLPAGVQAHQAEHVRRLRQGFAQARCGERLQLGELDLAGVVALEHAADFRARGELHGGIGHVFEQMAAGQRADLHVEFGVQVDLVAQLEVHRQAGGQADQAGGGRHPDGEQALQPALQAGDGLALWPSELVCRAVGQSGAPSGGQSPNPRRLLGVA